MVRDPSATGRRFRRWAATKTMSTTFCQSSHWKCIRLLMQEASGTHLRARCFKGSLKTNLREFPNREHFKLFNRKTNGCIITRRLRVSVTDFLSLCLLLSPQPPGAGILTEGRLAFKAPRAQALSTCYLFCLITVASGNRGLTTL